MYKSNYKGLLNRRDDVRDKTPTIANLNTMDVALFACNRVLIGRMI